MKRTWMIFLLVATCLVPAFADRQTVTLEASGLRNAREPRVFADVVLLTYKFPTAASPGQVHTVQAAFEHENYGELHPYQLNDHGVYVLLHQRDPSVAALRYRLVVDGVWTTDPLAPGSSMDRWGVRISEFPIPETLSSTVTYPHVSGIPERGTDDGAAAMSVRGQMVEFRFRAPPGQSVALVGSFNGWDPFMTPMRELEPGLYARTLRLNSGEHLYYFLVDGVRIPDPHNAERRWASNGVPVSVVQLP